MEVLKKLPCWLLIVSAALVVVLIFNAPSTSSDWAAWVQAVGSILAIASGFVFHFWQLSLAELRRLEKLQKAIIAARREVEKPLTPDGESGDISFDPATLLRIVTYVEENSSSDDLDFETAMLLAFVAEGLFRYGNKWRSIKEGNHDELRSLVEIIYDTLDLAGEFKIQLAKAENAIRRRHHDLARWVLPWQLGRSC